MPVIEMIEPEEKPCRKLGYCPYGPIVEKTKLNDGEDPTIECNVFGHHCPAFYVSEPFVDAEEEREEIDERAEELIEEWNE